MGRPAAPPVNRYDSIGRAYTATDKVEVNGGGTCP